MIFKFIKKLRKKKPQYTILRPHFTVEAYRGAENKPFKVLKTSGAFMTGYFVNELLEYNPVFEAINKKHLKRKVKIIKPCGCVEEHI